MRQYGMLKHNSYLFRVAAVFLIIPLMLQMGWPVVKAESAEISDGISSDVYIYYGDEEIYAGLKIEAGERLYARYIFKAPLSGLEGTRATLTLPKGLQAVYATEATTIMATCSNGKKLDAGTLTIGKDKSVTVNFYSDLAKKAAAGDEDSDETYSENDPESPVGSSGEIGNSEPESSVGSFGESGNTEPESSGDSPGESGNTEPESPGDSSGESGNTEPENPGDSSRENGNGEPENPTASGENADVLNFLFMPVFASVGSPAETTPALSSPAETNSDDTLTVEFSVPATIDTTGLRPNGDGSYTVKLENGGETVEITVVPDGTENNPQPGTHPVATGATTAAFAMPLNMPVASPYALSTPPNLSDVATIGTTALKIDGNLVGNNSVINVGSTALVDYSFHFQIDASGASAIKNEMTGSPSESPKFYITLPTGFDMPLTATPFTKVMTVTVTDVDTGISETYKYGTLYVDPPSNEAYIIFEGNSVIYGNYWDTAYTILAVDDGHVTLNYAADTSGFSAGTSYSVALADGTTIDIYVNPPVKKPGITKTGTDLGNGLIEWAVTYTPVATGGVTGSPYDIIFKDTLDDNQTYVSGSFKVDNQQKPLTPDPPVPDSTTGKTTIEYTYTKTDPSTETPIVFTYQTALSAKAYASSGGTSAHNDVVMSNNGGIPTVNAIATVGITAADKKWLTKTWAAGTGVDNKTIIWTVTISTKNLGSSIEDLRFSDTMSPGLELDVNSIKIYPNNTGTGTYEVPAPVDNSNVPYASSAVTNFSFAIDPVSTSPKVYADTYTIKYTTTVDDAYYNYAHDYTFSNAASAGVTIPNSPPPDSSFINPPPVGPVPGTGRDIVKKSSGGYTVAAFDNRYIEWNITVNDYSVDVQSGTITDTIPAGLEYVSSDTTITYDPAIQAGNTDPITFVATAAGTNNTTKVTFNVASLGTTKATIKIVTKVTDAALSKNGALTGSHAGKLTFTNRVDFSGQVAGNPVATIGNTANQDVDSNVIKKAGAFTGNNNNKYDYTDKGIKWTVTVNENQIPMPNAVLTDKLPPYLTYDASSLAVKEVPGGNPVTYTVIQTPDPATNGNTLKIKFPDDAIKNKKVEVSFVTKVNAEVYAAPVNSITGDFQLKNDAELTWDNRPSADPPPSGTYLVEIPNNTVAKSNVGGYDPNTNEIKYSVAINPLVFKFVNCTLVDEIPKELKLDLGSVQLYEAQVDNVGKITHTAQKATVPLGNGAGQWNWEYDESASQNYNKFTIYLPNDSNKCYILEYTCLLMELADSVTNTITFSGTSYKKSDSHIGVSTVSADTASIALFKARSISLSIKKVDSKRPEIPIEGIAFNLYTMVGDHKEYIASDKTDRDGKLNFPILSAGREYWLVEEDSGFLNGYDTTSGIVIAKGLEGDQKLTSDKDSTYVFKTGSTSGSVTEITIVNNPYMRNIDFKKVRSSNGLIVPDSYVYGAGFTIRERNTYNRSPFTAYTDSATSSGNGIVSFKDVPYPAEYDLWETSAPASYTRDGDTYTLSIGSNGYYTITSQTTGEQVYDGSTANTLWEVKNDYNPPAITRTRDNGPRPLNTPIIGPSIPHPHSPRSTIVTYDDGKTYIELDEDGNPVGEWRRQRNEDGYLVWVYEEYDSESESEGSEKFKESNDLKNKDHPDTGDSSMIFLWILFFYTSMAVLIALIWTKHKEKRR